MRQSVLVEEVGECAHALNYGSADQDNLKAELIQVATMALASLAVVKLLLPSKVAGKPATKGTK